VALQSGTDPLWVCEGAFDALALLATGIPQLVAIFGMQGWRWAWSMDVRSLLCTLGTALAQKWPEDGPCLR